jgi:hypothetical protein
MDKLQKDVLVGCLLGDAHLCTNTGQTWRLRILHSYKQKEYLEHLYGVFKSYCKTGPIQESFFDSRTQKQYFRVYFNSLYTDEFRFYGQSFYKKALVLKEEPSKHKSELLTGLSSKLLKKATIKKVVYTKKIPKNIHKVLTARALAYWFMDDGALKWKSKVNSYVFCTDSFSKNEVLLLKEALERNFNLKVTLQRKNAKKESFRLYISTESALVFKTLISPYVHTSMLYKLTEK